MGIWKSAWVTEILGKFKLLYLRNYSADRAEIWCAPLIPFSLKLIQGLRFYDDLNFLKNVTPLAAADFKWSSLIVLYKKINVHEHLGLN